ncbi:MAG: hypothetical protein EXR59_04115 [Dehalococcoidia bacterium]|nr:hypothetical protein [Dehalococcoidia bacterium]
MSSSTTLKVLKYAVRSDEALSDMAELIFQPLVEYDRAHQSDLLHTLNVFLKCGGNQSKTSLELFLHRSSLLYRLRRIEELSGFDLKDNEQRVLLQMCFLAYIPD